MVVSVMGDRRRRSHEPASAWRADGSRTAPRGVIALVHVGIGSPPWVMFAPRRHCAEQR